MKSNYLVPVVEAGFAVVPHEPAPQLELEFLTVGFSLAFAKGSLKSYSTLIYGFSYFLYS
jgi:hypothetical protein